MNEADRFAGDNRGDVEISGGSRCGIFGGDHGEVLQQFDLAPDPAPRVIVDQGAAIERRRPDIVPRQVEDDTPDTAAAGRGADALLGLIGTVAYFPERYGDAIIPLALGMLQKKSVPFTVFVKHQLITPRNVDLIYPLDERQDSRVSFTGAAGRAAAASALTR